MQLVTIAAQKKNLKESTIHTYRQSLKHFFKLTGKSWTELTITDADEFLTAKRLTGAMPETYNHYYAALRFMYKRVLKLNWDEDEIPRMKRDRSLHTVLSREEVNAILDITTNLKYKAIFAVMYSGGLRVSEITGNEKKRKNSIRKRTRRLGRSLGRNIMFFVGNIRYRIITGKACGKELEESW